MKISKKVLAAFSMAAALMMAVSVVSCKEEDDDDDYGILSKDNKDSFTINYTNDSDSVRRGYATTTNQYTGGLIKLTMDKASANAGAMGYIWDLQNSADAAKRAAKESRQFLIAGFNYTGSVVRPYVSLYKDVTDIELQNFGATGNHEDGDEENTANGATEKEYIKYGTSTYTPTLEKATVTKTVDGKAQDVETDCVVVTLDVYEDGEWTWEGGKRKYTSYNGGYVVDFYDGTVTLEQIASGSVDKKIGTTSKISAATTITKSDLGYTKNTDTTKSIVVKQTCAVYANVYAKKTLVGKSQYVKDYTSTADEVVEE